ncbi:unnamed protein product [Durusdinium trenchii]|uniref:PheRS DNA binding domain-containing protein n=1 Tax=Durusdinium trenchii TaxID=1381693 RepID=A0ABP0JY58_9DINO
MLSLPAPWDAWDWPVTLRPPSRRVRVVTLPLHTSGFANTSGQSRLARGGVAVSILAFWKRAAVEARLRGVRRRAGGFATTQQKPKSKEKYGPPDGFAAEKRLRSWLKDLGASGLDLVELGRSAGVWLKPKLTAKQLNNVGAGRYVLQVPKDAWITVDDSVGAEVEELLAAELLKERAKGKESKFEPYVDFLWRQDLARHPMFWTEEEISWLSGCKDVQDSVLSLQERTQKRIERLQKQLSASEEELRFALCVVEARAISTSAVPGALVPVLDHFRNDLTGSPALMVGDEGLTSGPMVAMALQDLRPGAELRNCFDQVTNQELFTQYGEVQIRMEDDEAVPEVNAYNEVPLPVRLPKRPSSSEMVKQAKVALLQKRAGIDLSSEAAALRLPMDAMPTGRLLPLARFIESPVPAGAPEVVYETLFDSLFKDCHPGLLPGSEEEWFPRWVPVPPAPCNAEELQLEVQDDSRSGPEHRHGIKAGPPVQDVFAGCLNPSMGVANSPVSARMLVADWYENLIGSYNRMSEHIQQEIQENSLKTSSAGSGDVELPEVTNAHYKAKRKDGSTAKSRTAKACRVLSSSIEDGTVVVQFLENGVRHTIPEEWVIKNTSAEGAMWSKPGRWVFGGSERGVRQALARAFGLGAFWLSRFSGPGLLQIDDGSPTAGSRHPSKSEREGTREDCPRVAKGLADGVRADAGREALKKSPAYPGLQLAGELPAGGTARPWAPKSAGGLRQLLEAAMAAAMRKQLVEYIEANSGFPDSEVLCREKGWDHEALVGAIKSLQAEDTNRWSLCKDRWS